MVGSRRAARGGSAFGAKATDVAVRVRATLGLSERRPVQQLTQPKTQTPPTSAPLTACSATQTTGALALQQSGGGGNSAVLDQMNASNAAIQHGDKAEAAFDAAKVNGANDAVALLNAIWDEPGDTAFLFGQAFVDSKLEPMTDVMHTGATVAGLSPVPGVQFGGKILGAMANVTDASVGIVTGDGEKTKEAVESIVVDLVLEQFFGHLKSEDARVASMYVNQAGEISKTGLEILVNNVGLTVASEVVTRQLDIATTTSPPVGSMAEVGGVGTESDVPAESVNADKGGGPINWLKGLFGG